MCQNRRGEIPRRDRLGFRRVRSHFGFFRGRHAFYQNVGFGFFDSLRSSARRLNFASLVTSLGVNINYL